MKPRVNRMQRTVTLAVLVLALAATASHPVAAAGSMVVEESATIAVTFVGFWTGPGAQVLIVVVAVPDEAPEPDTDSMDDRDKNGVILEDGAHSRLPRLPPLAGRIGRHARGYPRRGPHTRSGPRPRTP